MGPVKLAVGGAGAGRAQTRAWCRMCPRTAGPSILLSLSLREGLVQMMKPSSWCAWPRLSLWRLPTASRCPQFVRGGHLHVFEKLLFAHSTARVHPHEDMKKTRARRATTNKNILRVPSVLLVPFPMDVRNFLDGNLSVCVSVRNSSRPSRVFSPRIANAARQPARAGPSRAPTLRASHDARRSSHDALP